ncbi:MAG TPA: carboxypeptidase-like regulatory domain-containing protein, partial [Planctomycetaceae bacterium]|nr:carboxypeptidase-like regulatory domain-containing protein [Planctomycetaceae bacterium]
GIVLQAEGRAGTSHYFRGMARTNAKGEFEFQAYPEQAYLVAILNDHWTAPSRVVDQLNEDEPVSGLDFRLARGTVLRGKVTKADGTVQPNATVTLVQSAPAVGEGNAKGLVRWAQTDAEGRYQFRVSAGKYELSDPSHKQQIPLTINSQPEVIHDFRTDQ